MTIRELAQFCKERHVECDGCGYSDFCERMLPSELEDASPLRLVELLEEDVEEIRKHY